MAKREAKEPKARTFIPIRKEFVDSCKGLIDMAQQQARQAIAAKIATLRELRDDIPKDWTLDLERGGFVPPKER